MMRKEEDFLWHESRKEGEDGDWLTDAALVELEGTTTACAKTVVRD